MAFNVLFYGLVCHRKTENVSVFLDAQHHEHQLRMVVRHRDVISKQGFDVDLNDMHFALGTSEPQTSFFIGGRVLKVEGTTKVASNFTDEFNAFVPSLSRHASCQPPKVHPSIVNKETAEERVGAYLTHDGGWFSVNDFFPEKCTLTGDLRDAQCIARTTRLMLDAQNDVTITDGNGGRLVLSPTAEVRFVNTIPQPFGPMLTNRHFPMYYDVMYDGCTGSVPMEAQVACNHRHDPSFAVGGGDCSNSGDP